MRRLGLAMTAGLLAVLAACSSQTLYGGAGTPEPTTSTVVAPSPSVSSRPTHHASSQPKNPSPPHRSTSSQPKPQSQPRYPAVNNNPWDYNFSCCHLIDNPPSNFCDYFNCIATFWNGQGYVVECSDTMYSLSGGRQGVCSHHGGFYRNLYAP